MFRTTLSWNTVSLNSPPVLRCRWIDSSDHSGDCTTWAGSAGHAESQALDVPFRRGGCAPRGAECPGGKSWPPPAQLPAARIRVWTGPGCALECPRSCQSRQQRHTCTRSDRGDWGKRDGRTGSKRTNCSSSSGFRIGPSQSPRWCRADTAEQAHWRQSQHRIRDRWCPCYF